MALEDLGGPAGHGGGLQVDPNEAETMRDRALAQYLQRKEEFDRFREREAQRQAEQQPETQADEPPPAPKAARQTGARAQARSTEKKAKPGSGGDGTVEERLAEVPGLGPAKITALLREFGSLEELEQAGEDDLVQVTGIGQQLAREIVRTLG